MEDFDATAPNYAAAALGTTVSEAQADPDQAVQKLIELQARLMSTSALAPDFANKVLLGLSDLHTGLALILPPDFNEKVTARAVELGYVPNKQEDTEGAREDNDDFDPSQVIVNLADTDGLGDVGDDFSPEQAEQAMRAFGLVKEDGVSWADLYKQWKEERHPAVRNFLNGARGSFNEADYNALSTRLQRAWGILGETLSSGSENGNLLRVALNTRFARNDSKQSSAQGQQRPVVEEVVRSHVATPVAVKAKAEVAPTALSEEERLVMEKMGSSIDNLRNMGAEAAYKLAWSKFNREWQDAGREAIDRDLSTGNAGLQFRQEQTTEIRTAIRYLRDKVFGEAEWQKLDDKYTLTQRQRW